MASRGSQENNQLKDNIESQLNRLLQQLRDLEELKEDLDEEEYEEQRQMTMEQLREFQTALKKMMSGDMTLVNELGAVQLAIQAAISDAFKTPEVIAMFAKKQPGQLRERLSHLQAQVKLGKISKDSVQAEAVEILMALKKLGEPLKPAEEHFLQQHQDSSMEAFEQASASLGEDAQQGLLGVAGEQIKAHQ
eukprot:CAMPEP_0201521082 /NCGR_PEP_ID=MMETSP0161_2-20130828/14063_1 /ASSEMBLY_ACC=CAM_ASM_000251 /TAXON_ID=180227 /ORGANISM="Neoparamoeba aestuarina, Strain SoJaBio B1-5/56/2" /LENGTH=191 /DNA_ID=CAMNT_0047919649 /DNA_START=63 /DNA_END=638 /DNA_ORIENTATION=+